MNDNNHNSATTKGDPVTITFDAAAYDLQNRFSSFCRAARHNGIAITCVVEAELHQLAEWGEAHPLRPAAALSAYLTGVNAAQAIDAAELSSGQFHTYMAERRAGVGHYDAYHSAMTTHVCEFRTKVADNRCTVLGTGSVVTTRSCSCGITHTHRAVYRYSGD